MERNVVRWFKLSAKVALVLAIAWVVAFVLFLLFLWFGGPRLG